MNDQHIPTAMPTTNRPINMGTSLDDDTGRLDAVAKVTGKAKYGRDTYLPNGLFAAFVRCPYGNGTLEGTDVEAARAVPGVIEVEMTRDRGRYHGQPAGHVLAESRQALHRGMRALAPQWKRGQAAASLEDAGGDRPPTEDRIVSMLEGADQVLEAVYSTPAQTHSPLETHGGVVDHRGDSATAYISTQGTFAARDGLVEHLDLPRSKYEVVCEYVGGGFGSKLNGAGKEGILAARLSKKHGRPVYVFIDRKEDHLDAGNRPSSRSTVRIGFNQDGTIVGGHIHTEGGVGVGRRGGGVRFPSGRYNLGELQRTHADVQFAGGEPRAFRAPGCPQGSFAEELMLDEVAAAIGMDPLDLRLKLETDDDRREMLDQGAGLIGWSDRRANGSQGGAQSGALRRGFGVGTASWGRFPSRAEAELVINRDGSIEVRTGTQDIGTGQRTVMGVVAATNLGVPLREVEVRIGRSALPLGPASGGSVTAHNSAPAMARAAQDAKGQLLEAVASHVDAAPDELELDNGAVTRDGKALMTFAEACAKIPGEAITGRGEWNLRRENDTTSGHSHGAQFVEIEVDAETGVIRVKKVVAIQACGQVVMRKGAESQIIGGVIQGISYALFENKLLDRNTGTMVNGNLEQYKIAGTGDMPHIVPVLYTRNQTGVRSLGEPPTIPTAGAIAGALFNAIGTPVRSLPLTPDKVLAALEGGVA